MSGNMGYMWIFGDRIYLETSPRRKGRECIEIMPLIDIIFFLLATFVMVSLSMVKNRGIPVRLPSDSTDTPQEQGEVATISINAVGSLFYNKQPVAKAQLGDDLKQLLAGDAAAPLGPTRSRLLFGSTSPRRTFPPARPTASSSRTNRSNALYILDTPNIGLHIVRCGQAHIRSSCRRNADVGNETGIRIGDCLVTVGNSP